MLVIRDAITTDTSDDVRVYLPASAQNDSDAKEFIANGRFEESVASTSDGRMLFDDLTFKADFIRTFQEVKGMIDLRPGHTVLELGAAHGWASVLLKDDVRDAHVVVSDLVPECLKHCQRYERLLGRRVDEKWAFSVRDIPFDDAQFDRVFTFASFHHFGDHGDYAHTVEEIARILKPGGRLVLLYEPTSPAVLYRWAFSRVNKKRAHEGLDEDVLVVDKLEAIAGRVGMTVQATPFPFYRHRDSVAATVYYYVLAKLHLARFVVCTANMVLEKR